jgi:hypothetical protein
MPGRCRSGESQLWQVGFVALRQTPTAFSGRNLGGKSARHPASPLRRWTRRYSSQRDEFCHIYPPQREDFHHSNKWPAHR